MSKTKELKARLLSKEGNVILKNWLLSREHDIAIGFEDYGCLNDLFLEVFERNPQGS